MADRNSNLKYVDLKQEGEDFCMASSISDTVIFIPLETTNESILKEIRKLVLTDSEIIVCDGKKLLAFDLTSGKYLHQIGSQGKGPEEYTAIMDFTVKKDFVYISSIGTTDILKFGVDGNFKEKIKQKDRLRYFESIPSGGFASYDQKGEFIVQYDTNFNVQDTINLKIEVSKKLQSFTVGSKHFRSNLDNLLLTTYISDTIWRVTPNDVLPFLITNLDEKLLPANLQLKYVGDMEKYQKISSRYYRLIMYPVSSHILFHQLSWGRLKSLSTIPLFVYSFSTKETKKYNSPLIFDDMISGYGYFPFFTSQDYIISYAYPFDLKGYIDDGTLTLSGIEILDIPNLAMDGVFKSQMRNLKIEDNPVIILMKAK